MKGFNNMKTTIKIIIKLFNCSILWCFGWKRKKFNYYFRDLPGGNMILWRDPIDHNCWLPLENAIIICEKRLND